MLRRCAWLSAIPFAVVTCSSGDEQLPFGASGSTGSAGSTASASSTTGGMVCIPGAQLACACPGGDPGVQVCNPEGTGLGPCECGGAGGAGGASACRPGSVLPCYSGPRGTAGVGICAAGAQTCEADGSGYGPCLGEVLPGAETCALPTDEDCDGAVNEEGAGCACAPGTQGPCYSGAAGTDGVGPCHAGTQICNEAGTGFGPCSGEITPIAETCDTGVDDDCDGQLNEEGVGCVCVPASTTSCYDGPAGTLGVGTCVGGTKVCEPLGTSYGPCVGEVTPQQEDCATAADESCDGTPGPCQGSPLWSKKFGDAVPQYAQYGKDVAIDPSDGVALVVDFTGSINFGGGNLMSAAQSTDMAIAKFDGAGNHQWSKRFGDASLQSASSVAADGSGNVVLIGTVEGSADFGGGQLFAASGDMAVAKFDSAGNHVWSQLFGGGANATQSGLAVAIDSGGNLAVTGLTGGPIDFGGGPLPGNGTLALAKLDPAGGHVWSKRLGLSGGQFPTAIAVDGTGRVIVTGYFYGGSIDFGGGALSSTGFEDDVFVGSFTAGGTHVWSKRFGDGSRQQAYGVAAAPNGDVVIVGRYLGVLDFGGGPLPDAGTMINTDDLFIARFDSLGNHLWSKGFGSGGQVIAFDVTATPGGNTVLTGFASGAVDFGGGPLPDAGSQDIVVVTFAPDGTHVSSKRFGGPSEDVSLALARFANGDVALTGFFAGTLDFGEGPLVAGGYDTFLARVVP